jgi:cytoskeleton protein RodZ
MASFGERLKREREMRGVSLEEIAESTKIGKRHLQALETEDFDQLPGGIFNKGFVRAYSKYLGLDEEQAVTDFLAAENAASTGIRRSSSGD